MPINKQPIFTATPLLITNQFSPKVPTRFIEPGIDNCTQIYVDNSDNGSLITKITVVSTGIIGDTVTTKVIYLGIQDKPGAPIALYQSKVMEGINNLTSSNIVPYVTFTFDGGLIMNTGMKLFIATSTNREITSQNGDEISVIVEGGTYDQPT